MRLLVVEDEPALLDQLSRALTAAGYAVDTAADGDRADFAVMTETYDALLLDLGLPCNGWSHAAAALGGVRACVTLPRA